MMYTQSAVKTNASVRSAKLFRLGRLYERMAELKIRLTALEAGEVFAPEADSGSSTPAGRKPKRSTDTATRATKSGKGAGKATKAAKEPKKRAARRSADSDDEEFGDSDDDFVAPPPKMSSRGRMLKTVKPMGRSGSSSRKSLQSTGVTEEDDFALALQLSMGEF